MPYQPNYAQPQYDYAGYQPYGQVPQQFVYQTDQTQYLPPQPTFAFPQPPRHQVAQVRQTAYQPQIASAPQAFQQPLPQYQRPTHEQYSYPQAQPVYGSQGSQGLVQQYPQFTQQPSFKSPQLSQASYPPPGQGVARGPPAPAPQQPQKQPSHSSASYSRPFPAARSAPHPPAPSRPPQGKSQTPRLHAHSLETPPQKRKAQQTPSSGSATSAGQPRPQQRVVQAVQIPAQKSSALPATPTMPRSPKRRRSNDGHAVPVCHAERPKPQERKPRPQTKQEPVSSSPLTELPSSQIPPTPKSDLDSQSVLLALADEYTNAAYSLSSSLTSASVSDEQFEQYHSLMATAMGCLESVLKNFRQDPRREARVRLRLASLLVEETDNHMEAEEVLTKGIALCERSRIQDVKYAMQHLLARLLSKTQPKAAFKTLDRLIPDVEALGLVHWMYSFRLLRVTLSLQAGDQADKAAVIKHLKAVVTNAEEQRHVAVGVVANALEAMVHLRSGIPDAVDLTQRAIAAARSHQLGPEMQGMHQIRILLECLDLACSLIQFNPEQAANKLNIMHNNMDSAKKNKDWGKDEVFLVELAPSPNASLEMDTGGVMKRSDTGHALLAMRWMTKPEVYTAGFLLSGFANMHKNSTDGRAALFLQEGLKFCQTPFESDLPSQSLAAAVERLERRKSMAISIRLCLIFAHCSCNDWPAVRKVIKEVKKQYAQAGDEIDEPTMRMLMYLEAVCRQAMGDLASALDLYRSPTLRFTEDRSGVNAEKDLRVVASLNSILILRAQSENDSAQANHLLAAVEPYCIAHPNKSFLAAYYMIKATSQSPNGLIIKRKQHLQSAVSAAKANTNNQLLCIVMNLMTSTYFTNIVSEQAEKSCEAGRHLAKKTKDRLWMSVADGMFEDIKEKCGKAGEAEAARREGQALLAELPKSLKKTLVASELEGLL